MQEGSGARAGLRPSLELGMPCSGDGQRVQEMAGAAVGRGLGRGQRRCRGRAALGQLGQPSICASPLYTSFLGAPGVGSLFLLQRIFLTQESNRSLLHCRQIVYQLIYQGSPNTFMTTLVVKELSRQVIRS